ncbi:hypothetical protein HXX76_010964 [Chlamydomonas incerta]|uniref:Sfi1 spindle body domain-containing protein n=1 Tax=Chlamydomonas incerta TaxID=51695 RepID=A0A835SCW1_CHLIN|nr:hypothetical protein HXX76_010964 [Chlamydomonas incerta]|eukprot:KAG2423196.1 hypothetical protein HXX76_010964 [Chlamydomonas incerta]
MHSSKPQGKAAQLGSPGPAASLLGASWASGVWPSATAAGPPDPEEEARRARRRHRKRVARIVVDQWKAFAAGRLRALAARRHYRKRLLTAALVAWQAEAVAARVKLRQAAVHDLKRVFLSLGRCVQAWHVVAARAAELRALQARAEEAVAVRRARACLRAWRGRCHYAADKKRRELQAWYYWSFSSLTRALRKWHAWARERRRKSHRASRADAGHLRALGRKAFAGWRLRLAYRGWKAQALDRAAVFGRRWSLWRALSGWRRAVVACQGARAAARAALEMAAERAVVAQLRGCLTEWRAYAAHRRRRAQRGRYAEAYMRRWRQLLLMWGWRQAMARQRHLRRCELVFVQVGQHVRMGLAWARWAGAVALLQGQRNAELRALVLLRASWATWRAVVEHRAAQQELLAIASKRVGRVRLRAAMAEWRSRAAHWQRKAERWERAKAWHRRRAFTKLLAGWRRAAARLAAKAAAAEAAVLHWAWRRLSGAFKAWRRYAWRRRMKRQAPEHYRARLAATALAGWTRHAHYKVQKEVKRRRAVRHRYLALLRGGLRAFAAAVERRRAKLADWADLELLHRRRVARAVLAAWHRDFVPAAAAKRAARRGAEQHWRAGLLRRVWLGWRGEARRLRAKLEGVRQARGYYSLRLLRRAMACWSAAAPLAQAARAAKAARLADAAARLAACVRARLLAAWRDVTSDLIVKHLLEARAERLWRWRLQGKALTSWALFVAARRRRHIREAQATAAFRLRVWRGVLVALALNAQRRRAKRRRAAIAEEHWRAALLRRGVAALAWYARYRAVKAQGYADARQAYGRRLAREGAAMWLEVGLERRRRRIQDLVAVQARSIARELAIVEPFARRWLYAVRQRRRARLLETAAAVVGRAGYFWAGGPGGGYPSGGLGTAAPGAVLAAAAALVLRREGLWAGGNPYLALGRSAGAHRQQPPEQKQRCEFLQQAARPATVADPAGTAGAEGWLAAGSPHSAAAGSGLRGGQLGHGQRESQPHQQPAAARELGGGPGVLGLGGDGAQQEVPALLGRPLTAGGGIAIHQSGPAPPDVFRLPTRGTASAAAPGETEDGGTLARRELLLDASQQPLMTMAAEPTLQQVPQQAASRVLSWRSTGSPLHPAVPSVSRSQQVPHPQALLERERPVAGGSSHGGRLEAEAELEELESVLLHCRDAKQRLGERQQVSSLGDAGWDSQGGDGASEAEARQLRAELAALRPLVAHALVRLEQLRAGVA